MAVLRAGGAIVCVCGVKSNDDFCSEAREQIAPLNHRRVFFRAMNEAGVHAGTVSRPTQPFGAAAAQYCNECSMQTKRMDASIQLQTS